MIGLLIAAFIGLMLVAVVLYWQLVVAEGAYLGRRVVAWLYDLYAPRYDRVKRFHPANDAVMLAMPILQHLAAAAPHDTSAHDTFPHPPLVLDVATGTGRLPQALLSQPGFRGRIVALDLSSRMLAQAQAKLDAYANRILWLRQDAQCLPFDSHAFDAVTCLEALEFFPDSTSAIHEMFRVLKPGGLLLISNRIGPDAWKLPGRTTPTPALALLLTQIGLAGVATSHWLVDYDLVQAYKPIATQQP